MCGLDWTDLRQSSMASSCERRDEPSGAKTVWEFLDQLRDY
jgi:hypothetical protein